MEMVDSPRSRLDAKIPRSGTSATTRVRGTICIPARQLMPESGGVRC